MIVEVEKFRFSFEPDRIDKKSIKVTYQNPKDMKTEVKIPFEIKQIDPEWLNKKFSGKPLTQQEKELYIKYKYEKEFKFLKKNMRAPGGQDIMNCFMENQRKLVQCQIHCGTTGWNTAVYDGIFGGCGPQHPFEIWNKYFKMKEYDDWVDKFMDQYEIETFQRPTGEKARVALNKFFQSRYGMFAGYDAKAKYGLINYDSTLIEMWEKPKELRRVWNLAIMSTLMSN